jgi:hypothetical protein
VLVLGVLNVSFDCVNHSLEVDYETRKKRLSYPCDSDIRGN